MADEQAMIAGNRRNIPSICRIPGRGTAFLVAPGLIMTSLCVVGSKMEAAKLKAVFFESGKQAPVVVDLNPYRVWFVSAYPEYLSYAVVAVDTRGIHNVVPVRLPIVDTDWVDVTEGGLVLSVQHPLPVVRSADEEEIAKHAATSDVDHSETKQFLEVTRASESVFYFAIESSWNCAGCPVFNNDGVLVGLHTQVWSEETNELVSRAVYAKEIMKHLFANGKLGLFENMSPTKDILHTWYTDGDVSRALRILQNFQETEIVTIAMEELCRHSSNETKMQELMYNDGARIILENMHRFRIEEGVVAASLRTLWNLSFGDDSRRKKIVAHGGMSIIIQGMDKFCNNEQIVEYGCVLLYNLSSLPEHVTADICDKGIPAVLKAIELYPKSEVIMKFTLGVLMNIAEHTGDDEHVRRIVQLGGVERACAALSEFVHNEYLVENSVLLLSAVVAHRDFALHPALRASVIPLINVLKMYSSNKLMARHGNQALWYLGLNPVNRVTIVRHEGLDVLDATIDAVAQTLGT